MSHAVGAVDKPASVYSNRGDCDPSSEGSTNISRNQLGLLLGFVGVCLFAGTLPATRLAVTGLDPLFLTAARATLAGSAGLIVLVVARRPIPPRSDWSELFAAGFCTVLSFPLLVALAMMTLPASHGGIVLGILPTATAVAAVVLAGERPSFNFWLASAGGGIVVLTFVLRQSGAGLSLGDLFLLGAVAAGAVGYTLSGHLTARMPGWEVISWQVVLFLPLAALATWALCPPDLADIPASSWAGLAYVGFISQYAAFFVFNAALAMGGIAHIGQLTLLQPFVILALAVPVNNEPIRLETIAFAAAVVAIVLVGQRTRVRRL
jgi:drug/metabolite transporter (DMT)-like permease